MDGYRPGGPPPDPHSPPWGSSKTRSRLKDGREEGGLSPVPQPYRNRSLQSRHVSPTRHGASGRFTPPLLAGRTSHVQDEPRTGRSQLTAVPTPVTIGRLLDCIFSQLNGLELESADRDRSPVVAAPVY